LTSARADECIVMPGPCSLLDQAQVIFVGTALEGGDRFRVTEAFKGIRGDRAHVVGLRTHHYEVGEQYLVFASVFEKHPDGPLLVESDCSLGRRLDYAAAILEQLRAEKSGKPVAAVYGVLYGYPGPLPNILVRLRSVGKSYEARTDEQGAYAFRRLPPGTYQVSAELPPNLVLGQSILSGAPPPELSRRSCSENDLYALRTGRIAGRVFGPDGKVLHDAGVELYRASEYNPGKEGRYGDQYVHGPSGSRAPSSSPTCRPTTMCWCSTGET